MGMCADPGVGNRSAWAEFACRAGKRVRYCVRCSTASGGWRARWRYAGRLRPLEAASFAEDPPAVRGESVQGGILTGHGLKKP